MNVFDPSITYSSPCLIALVLTLCRSEPVPGSVIAIAPTSSPLASLGSQRCFCSSVPYVEDVVRHDRRCAPRCRGSAPCARTCSSTSDRLVREGAAAAAVLRRDGRAEQAELAGLVPDLAVDVLLLAPPLFVAVRTPCSRTRARGRGTPRCRRHSKRVVLRASRMPSGRVLARTVGGRLRPAL